MASNGVTTTYQYTLNSAGLVILLVKAINSLVYGVDLVEQFKIPRPGESKINLSGIKLRFNFDIDIKFY
jgi:hypothetical protein